MVGSHQIVDVLIVEDKDAKFSLVREALIEWLGYVPDIHRESTIIGGEDALEARKWSLAILDISMDIAGGETAGMRGGHANLGGLDIIERMFLLSIDIPTIVVTGFDYFQSLGAKEVPEFIGIPELDRRVMQYLGDNYLGCLRYGIPGWRDEFARALEGLRR